jgi:hypothetical protein
MLSIRHTAQRFAFGALVFATFACDDGDTSVRSQKCDEICAHYEMCDDGTDETGCQDRCKAETFRSDAYFEVKAECALELTCNRLEERDDSEDLTDCIRRVFRDAEPIEDVQNLCTSLGNKLADCDSGLDRAVVSSQCEPIAITLSEEYLSASQTCASEICVNVETCLENLADDYSTQVKVYGGEIDLDND